MIIISGVLAYLIGSVTFGMIVPRLMGTSKDVRKEGSGNVGATNVFRTQGKLQGLLVMLGDMLKGVVAALIGISLAGTAGGAVAGACVFLGHCFPLYFGFKGGKGVATGCGIVFVLFPKSMVVLLPIFVLLVLATRMVSVGSITGALALGVCLWLFRPPLPVAIVCALTAVTIIWKHNGNIKRILAGTENKLW